MRSPICTNACWMWRGCLSSRRYPVSCFSESCRPNQVFHQNRNGMSTISQAVAKNRMRWPVDMRRRFFRCSLEDSLPGSGGGNDLGRGFWLSGHFVARKIVADSQLSRRRAQAYIPESKESLKLQSTQRTDRRDRRQTYSVVGFQERPQVAN